MRWSATASVRAVRGALVVVLLAPGCLRVPGTDALPAPAQPDAPPVSAVLWPGRTPDALYAQGELRAFRIEQGGQLIARSWGRYAGRDAAGHHIFETRIELLPPGMDPVRSEGRLQVDDRGELVSGFERSALAELTFMRRGDVLTISDGTRTDEVAFDDGTAYIAHGAILHTELMFGLRRLVDGELAWRVVSLSGGPPFAWSAQVEQAPTATGQAAVIKTNLGERITLREGRILELEAEGAAQRVVPDVGATWPAWSIVAPQRLSYAPPPDANFRIQAVEIEGRAEEPTLSGDLLVPPGAEASPRAAVLFLSRMAGEDRYGFSGPPAADIGSHEIQDALAQAGLVVLRFDERGTGRSEAGPSSYDAQVQDARRAYATLLIQPVVDPSKVIVIGHGEGGLRALALGVQEGEHLAGVVTLAAPGRSYVEVLRHQAEVRLASTPPALRQRALDEQQTMIAAMIAGEPPPELAMHAQWLTEIFAVNPARLISQQRAPLLFVQGDKDFEVDPAVDLAGLVRAAKKNKKAHRVLQYRDLDHLLKREAGVSKPERYREDRRVDETFIADLIAWARQVTR